MWTKNAEALLTMAAHGETEPGYDYELLSFLGSVVATGHGLLTQGVTFQATTQATTNRVRRLPDGKVWEITTLHLTPGDSVTVTLDLLV